MANKFTKLLKQAERHFEKGDLNFARQCYEKILAEDPGHLESLNNLGVLLFQEGHIDMAIDHFQDVLKADGQNADALANLDMVASFLAEKVGMVTGAKPRLKVGFISIWFERGQSYVTKMIRDAVATAHETFVFARTGGVYGRPMLETSGQWAIPNLTVWPQYDISGEAIGRWIRDNKLDIVVFNEEYDWELVKAVKRTGVKVFTYLDYYKDNWKQHMDLYDAVLCSTKRTHQMVKDSCRAYYIGWGVDTDLFCPPTKEPEFTFFHNAGWLGINFRKMTPAVIAAFDAVSRLMPDVSLFVHSQAGIELLPPVVVDMVNNNPRIAYHVETLPAPGLYHKGKIMVFPTKLEGLGLPLFEGLSCGLPVIATNAPPMNEFVTDHFNGLLVDLALRTTRDDNVAFPEEIVNMTDLAVKMAWLANDETLIRKTGANARRFAEEELTFSRLAERILHIFAKVCST
jgi:1,2-diacylglycerol 3-alpha-glucosyltransferase